MINEEFMEILREHGSVSIEYSPPVEESHLGSWGESVLFIIRDGEHSWVLNSGAYVMDGLDATMEDETLDRLAARLVEAKKKKIELEKIRSQKAEEEAENWEVSGTWLSQQ